MFYGLKQSPRQWYAKMHMFLQGLTFRSSQNDPCLYTRHSETGITIIALYVDDLLIAGNNLSEIQSIKEKLSAEFEMKDLGDARTMLGIDKERGRSSKRLFISQTEYTRTVLAFVEIAIRPSTRLK